jgi:Flp pilus assembly protein TadD
VRAEQRDLIKAYAADVVGHNQLAVCAGQLRDFKTARDEMAAIVELLPRRTIFRNNLALQSITSAISPRAKSRRTEVLKAGAGG